MRTEAVIPATRIIAINMIKEPTPIAAFSLLCIALIKVIFIPSPPSYSCSYGKFEKDYVLILGIATENKNVWF